MVTWSTFDCKYVVVCGNQTRYVAKFDDAHELLNILKFGEELKKLFGIRR